MRNTGDLRLVSGLNCGGIYCFLLLSEWKEVTPSLLNSQITYWFATVNIYSDRSCKLTKTRGELIRIDPYFRLHPSGWEDVLPCLAMAMWYPQGWTAMANIYRIFLPRVLMPFSVSCFSPASMSSTSKQKCLILGHWGASLFSPALNTSIKLDSLICS